MVFSVEACALIGIVPHLVICEVDLSLQLPAFQLVGLPSSMTQESKERVRAATQNSDLEWPARKITVNLLPSDLPKWGSHFELAMALGILGASIKLNPEIRVFALGELSLSGDVRPLKWSSFFTKWIQFQRCRKRVLHLFMHPDDAKILSEALVDKSGFQIYSVPNLKHAFEILKNITKEEESMEGVGSNFTKKEHHTSAPLDIDLELLKKVRQEPLGVVGALIAIANRRHHAIFVGPHGMGKSMLIRAVVQASKNLLNSEKEEIESLIKVFGDFLAQGAAIDTDKRPVRYLQTSTTRAALEGALLNSGQVVPGELMRAHHGTLVLDELLEFRRDVIEILRQPLEEKLVRLQRAKIRSVLPCDFQLLASSNLCPCGNFGLQDRLCRCRQSRLSQYQEKLSGPILDRFDLVVLVGQKYNLDTNKSYTAKKIINILDQSKWKKRLNRIWDCHIQADSFELTNFNQLGQSHRSLYKLSHVAHTIALFLNEPIDDEHVEVARLLRYNLNSLFVTPLQRWSRPEAV